MPALNTFIGLNKNFSDRCIFAFSLHNNCIAGIGYKPIYIPKENGFFLREYQALWNMDDEKIKHIVDCIASGYENICVLKNAHEL